jgi:hypothetical protein
MVTMTGLASAIIAVKPREKAGALTGARYAFQAHVSLAKILDLHEAASDYRAVFDHFDDLTILSDASNAPATADFYQIKGKAAGNWTAAALCSPSGAAPQTIVGKMYHHTVGFGAGVNSCTFVTNAPFAFVLADGEKTTPDHVTVTYASLGTNDQAQFKAALDLDFKAPRSPDESAVIRFERTGVPTKDYDTFLKGRLVDFLPEDGEIAVAPLYRILIADIVAKANDTTECDGLTAVFVNKSLSRDDLESALSASTTRRSVLDHWSVVDDELKTALRSSRTRVELKTAVIAYLAGRSKRSPEATAFAAAATSAAANIAAGLGATDSLLAAADLLKAATTLPPIVPYVGVDLEAAFLVEAFEAEHG